MGANVRKEVVPVGAWAEPWPTVNATVALGSALYPMIEPGKGCCGNPTGKTNVAGSRRKNSDSEPPPAAAPPLAATTAAATARRLLAGLVDGQGPAAKLFPIQRVDRCVGIGLTSHLHEGKTARAARVAIGDDPHFGHLPTPLREEGFQLFFIRSVRQIPDIQPSPHDPRPLSPRVSGAQTQTER